MNTKFRKRDKIASWFVAVLFIIMAILVMLMPTRVMVDASETIPATEASVQTDRVVVSFIEVTRPTEPAEPVEFTEPAEPATEPVEYTESVEEAPVKDEVENETQPQLEIEIESEPVEEPEPEPELKSLGRFKLTAYCACSRCCGKSDGITASGTKAKQGRTIAVDPKQIPYGTKVVINGHTYVAEDCGGGIGKSCIDVFFNSHKDALNFGVQYAEVYVYID